jgi:hypothetical protein
MYVVHFLLTWSWNSTLAQFATDRPIAENRALVKIYILSIFVIYIITLSNTQTTQHEMTGCHWIENNVEGRGRALNQSVLKALAGGTEVIHVSIVSIPEKILVRHIPNSSQSSYCLSELAWGNTFDIVNTDTCVCSVKDICVQRSMQNDKKALGNKITPLKHNFLTFVKLQNYVFSPTQSLHKSFDVLPFELQCFLHDTLLDQLSPL